MAAGLLLSSCWLPNERRAGEGSDGGSARGDAAPAEDGPPALDARDAHEPEIISVTVGDAGEEVADAPRAADGPPDVPAAADGPDEQTARMDAAVAADADADAAAAADAIPDADAGAPSTDAPPSADARRCPAAPTASETACNGADDDCDGVADDGFDVGQSCVTVTATGCRVYGTRACSPDGTSAACHGEIADIRPEICNLEDDDCNGTVDDVGGACGYEKGECRPGQRACDDQGREICLGATAPSEELCNGRDDDCDGATDEVFADRGAVCSVGLGVCQRTGRLACRSDGRGLACDVQPGPPSAADEVCDPAFEDEDCDGKSNQGCACIDGQSPDRPCAPVPGLCNPGAQRCRLGHWSDCEGQVRGLPETCNGADDDCNGTIDDGFDVGKGCVQEVRGCRRYGTRVCAQDGTSTVCRGEIADVRPEICNGLDDDCNDRIDDVGGPCGVERGVCHAGTRACDAAGHEICAGATLPSDELCNGADDDCDGATDEVFADKGAPCAVGLGACRRAGRLVCRPDGLGLACDAQPGAPSAGEACDPAFEDEDCDGRSNEGCECIDGQSADRPCAPVAGLCNPGVQRCRMGRWSDCEGQVRGTAERCNGADDDCDGAIDEDFDLGKSCVQELLGCRRYGTLACAPGGAGTVCREQIADIRPEVCNGIDDDCNERIDDVSGPCGVERGACHAGTRACDAAGHEICAGATLPSDELCNHVDDDCDGQTDETYDLGGACEAGVGACRAVGTRVCAPGGKGTVCDAVPRSPGREECNGLDDDCDGLPDFSLKDGVIVSACRCERQPLTPAQGGRDEFERAAANSVCTPSNGSLSMQFSLGTCPRDPPFPFAQCLFQTISLDEFDADHQGRGALEISFSLSTTLRAELSFYYGKYPRRKKLRVFSEAQAAAGIGPGCYRVFFSPSDAICPFYGTVDPNDKNFEGFDAKCAVGCSAGRWTDKSPSCLFSYASTILYATVEGCRADGQAGTASDIRVTHHGIAAGQSCFCTSTQGCPDLAHPNCDLRAALPDPRCAGGARCGGVCLTDAEKASACAFDAAESQ